MGEKNFKIYAYGTIVAYYIGVGKKRVYRFLTIKKAESNPSTGSGLALSLSKD
ncbi:hypothetical protein KKG24_05145 [Patescibacteria group bacterium]|nr:hypothetical protein [bacterium]MBU0999652.1 hypothetical protein [Patescibacteria group bacterium]